MDMKKHEAYPYSIIRPGKPLPISLIWSEQVPWCLIDAVVIPLHCLPVQVGMRFD